MEFYFRQQPSQLSTKSMIAESANDFEDARHEFGRNGDDRSQDEAAFCGANSCV